MPISTEPGPLAGCFFGWCRSKRGTKPGPSRAQCGASPEIAAAVSVVSAGMPEIRVAAVFRISDSWLYSWLLFAYGWGTSRNSTHWVGCVFFNGWKWAWNVEPKYLNWVLAGIPAGSPKSEALLWRTSVWPCSHQGLIPYSSAYHWLKDFMRKMDEHSRGNSHTPTNWNMCFASLYRLIFINIYIYINITIISYMYLCISLFYVLTHRIP